MMMKKIMKKTCRARICPCRNSMLIELTKREKKKKRKKERKKEKSMVHGLSESNSLRTGRSLQFFVISFIRIVLPQSHSLTGVLSSVNH